MDYPHLRVAMLSAPDAGAEIDHPFLIAGATRSWPLRRQRTEPLAVCFSFDTGAPPLEELLGAVEQAFRHAHKYSVTSSLIRALLAGHAHLAQRNQLSLVEHRHFASATIAAARPDGVYVARAGPSCVTALHGRKLVAGTNDPLGRSPPEAIALGYPAPPIISTERYLLAEGDSLLLLPGRYGATASERSLAAALDALPHLVIADALVRDASLTTSAFAVWRPDAESAFQSGGSDRWWTWTGAPLAEASVPQADAVADEPVARPADAAKPPAGAAGFESIAHPTDASRPQTGAAAREPTIRPAEPSTSQAGAAARAPIARPTQVDRRASAVPTPGGFVTWGRNVLARARPPRRLPVIGSAGWLLPLLPLAVILAVAILLLRAGLPTPGGSNQVMTDAGRIMQEAQANPDREVAASLLDETIAMLEPLSAGGNEGARALIADARRRQDRALDIVRVTRPTRANLPVSPEFRPAGLWKTGDSLLVLDLGGQVLYRTNPAGEQIEVPLRPGEIFEGQPVGRLVTAAWSPPRGSNTVGQLIVVDHVRSLLSLNSGGVPQRRWWPPDNNNWQRLGPAAAGYDDIFLLDTSREEVWRYPAQLPGAAGTVVAASTPDLDIGSVIDLATDGNLYLMSGNGQIARVAPGSGRLPFDGSVPYRRLQAPVAIFAHPDLTHVWVLEPGEARVVELTNQGTYVRQFVFPPTRFATLSDCMSTAKRKNFAY